MCRSVGCGVAGSAAAAGPCGRPTERRRGTDFFAVLGYFCSLALEGILSSAQESLLVLFGQKMTHALRSEMSRKLTQLPASTLAGRIPAR